MPRYKGRLTLEDEGPDCPAVHVFEYSVEDDLQTPKSGYRKQLIALESCIYVGRRNLAALRGRAHRSSTSQSEDATKPKKDQSGSGEESSTDGTANDKTESHQTEGESSEEMRNGEVNEVEKKTEKEEEEKEGKGHKEDKEKEKEGEKEFPLKEGQDFQGYILKCPNGPYDYALKIWDKGRAAPPEIGYPKEGREVSALVVDRAGDYLILAVGTNIAYATRKSFLCSGVDPDDLSLPFGRLKVSLARVTERPAEVPAAGWEATPTQVVVPPYDIY